MEQVWVILNKGYFIGVYSSRTVAYKALASLRDKGIVSDSACVHAEPLDAPMSPQGWSISPHGWDKAET